ncbi:MAG: ABC transporter ATP-binding protein [Bacillota bacterium]
MNQPLLELKNLQTYFYTGQGVVKAVDGVSFEIYKGETLGVVGESGSGKSVTSLSIIRLIQEPPGRIIAGEILFSGVDLLKKNKEEMRKIRGNEISMIFQEPMTSLNPVHTIGTQICEAIQLHQKKKRKEAAELALEMLHKVGIPLPEQRIKEYPHQLSGGMRQRVMIAMALSCNPKLLIADEPTTALDVTIQAQILDLMKKIQADFGSSIMLITHDLGVIAEIADRVAVMYAGKVVEYTAVKTLFKYPSHPYTLGLINSIPKLTGEKKRLEAIPGTVPDLSQIPAGCSFHPRCKFATKICKESEPKVEAIADGHLVRCWNHQQAAQAHS